ncbi:MAG: hypothetical protein AAF228_07505 [Pseudomonadota bacterium]
MNPVISKIFGMKILDVPSPPGRMFLSVGLVITFCILQGCAQQGDFGRPQQSIFVDTLGEEINSLFYADEFLVGDVKRGGKYTGPKFSLTPNEIELRDVALHFHQPLTAHNTRVYHSNTASDYAEDLTRKQYTYGPSRAKYIMSQIEADQKWLERFRKVASKVNFADQNREHALRVKNLMLTNRDRVRTIAQIKENQQIIHKIFQDLQQRVTNYQYAIERSRLEAPDQNFAQLDVALALLGERVVLSRTEYDKVTREYVKKKMLQLKKAMERARRKRMQKSLQHTMNKPKPEYGHLPWHKKDNQKKRASSHGGKALNSGKTDTRVEGKSLAPIKPNSKVLKNADKRQSKKTSDTPPAQQPAKKITPNTNK